MLHIAPELGPDNRAKYQSQAYCRTDEDCFSCCGIVYVETAVKVDCPYPCKAPSDKHPHRCRWSAFYSLDIAEYTLVHTNGISIFHYCNEDQYDPHDLHC